MYAREVGTGHKLFMTKSMWTVKYNDCVQAMFSTAEEAVKWRDENYPKEGKMVSADIEDKPLIDLEPDCASCGHVLSDHLTIIKGGPCNNFMMED